MRLVAAFLCVVLGTPLAAADAPPERPRKDVPYSVMIDNIAEVREHSIVLYPWHERAGVPWTLGVFTPGRELAVDPDAPEPQLFRVRSSDLPGLRIEVERAKSLASARTAVKMKGTECGFPLSKHQQVLATSPATSMRLHYTVDTRLLCERKLASQDVIEPEAGATPATGSAAATPSAAPASSSTPPSAAPNADPSARGGPGCGACTAVGGRPIGALLAPFAALCALLRRRRRGYRT